MAEVQDDDARHSRADRALEFNEARLRIERAKSLPAVSSLNFKKFRSLDRFPDLGELAQIKRLQAGGTLISNLEEVAKLHNLEILLINSTRVTDLSPISGLTRLTALNIHNNQISDLKTTTWVTKFREAEYILHRGI